MYRKVIIFVLLAAVFTAIFYNPDKAEARLMRGSYNPFRAGNPLGVSYRFGGNIYGPPGRPIGNYAIFSGTKAYVSRKLKEISYWGSGPQNTAGRRIPVRSHWSSSLD